MRVELEETNHLGEPTEIRRSEGLEIPDAPGMVEILE